MAAGRSRAACAPTSPRRCSRAPPPPRRTRRSVWRRRERPRPAIRARTPPPWPRRAPDLRRRLRRCVPSHGRARCPPSVEKSGAVLPRAPPAIRCARGAPRAAGPTTRRLAAGRGGVGGGCGGADAARQRAVVPPRNQEWARGAVFYEIFVRSFADSDGNGIGDFTGLTSKLDYLATLGVDGVWLMPVFESPSYHGYDTVD